MSIKFVVEDGILHAEPEFKTTNSGKQLVNFEVSVAQYQKDPGIFKFTAWGELAEELRSLVPGIKLAVRGRVSQRKYEWQGSQKTANEFVAESLEVQKTDTKQASKPQPAAAFDESIPF